MYFEGWTFKMTSQTLFYEEFLCIFTSSQWENSRKILSNKINSSLHRALYVLFMLINISSDQARNQLSSLINLNQNVISNGSSFDCRVEIEFIINS